MRRFTSLIGPLPFGLILLLTGVISGAHAQDEAAPIRWKDLFGVHYTADRRDAGMARGLPLHGWGWRCDVTDGEHEGIAAFRGPYSGEVRFHDFAGRYAGRRSLVEAVRHAGEMGVPILAPCGIINQPDALRAMLGTDGAYWKDLVYHFVKTFNSGEFAEHPVLHWQLGNEINGVGHFNIRMVDEELTKGPTRWREFNQDEQIDAYVELHFAPTAEAILRAAHEVYGDESPVKIVLGSVANFRNPRSREWLGKLLETEIKGARAPTLKGKRVWEVADIMSFHYLVTAAPPEWPEALDELYQRWIAAGRMEGMWATEEHGANGRGAVTTVRTGLRWLWWWGEQAWEKGRGRVFMWGDDRGKPGGRGRLGSEILYAFFGERPIRNAEGISVNVPAVDGLETYGFECGPKTALIALWLREGDASATIEKVEVGETDSLAPAGTAVKCVLLSNTEPPRPATVRLAGGAQTVSLRFDTPVQLRAGHEDTVVLLFGEPALELPPMPDAAP
ncbi:MAG: hypothetical protein ACE5JM_12275 [Armatimonadota bacterium]